MSAERLAELLAEYPDPLLALADEVIRLDAGDEAAWPSEDAVRLALLVNVKRGKQ